MRKRILQRRKKRRLFLFLTALFWFLSALTCVGMLSKSEHEGSADISHEVGKQYLSAVFPAINRGFGGNSRGDRIEPSDSLIVSVNEDHEEKEEVRDSISSKEPLILIYHTHATESYQPVSTGNFHSIDEAGTVREVGAALKKALEEKGIVTIQDKSIHDSPSYSKSYSRSLEAAQKILATSPSVCIIIDLHRDAASYAGNNKQVFTVDGKTAAQFSLVVGQGNENAKALKDFADRVSKKANSLYPGFSRGLILKEYKYNQHLADDYILLEMGNNQNSIEEAKLSAVLFADVLEEILKEIGL